MSPSAYITAYITRTGKRRYRVEWRFGGRASKKQHGGSFTTERDARVRRDAIRSELAAGRDPRLTILAPPADVERVTLEVAARRWQASRIDVSAATADVHRKTLAHALARFGSRAPETITAPEVAEWVGQLASPAPPTPAGVAPREAPYTPGTVRKALDALRAVLDHHGVEPNPARDRRVKLPRDVREEIEPPEAEAVERALAVMAPRYRLACLILDATGMRVGELESLRWGDLDVAGARWRVAVQREKSRRGRWVPVPDDLFALVDGLVPREDRDLEARVAPWLDQAALRRQIARACKATGTPLWSPHDLRHRRISLWHRAGVSWAQIGEWAGQRDLATTANRYTHVVLGREVDRAPWVAALERMGVRA